jgi:CRISPR-associated protein (TIGR03984 family)
MESIEKNGLKLLHIKSRHITEGMSLKLGDKESLETFVSQQIPCKSFAVAYLDNEVLVGRFNGNTFDFYRKKTIDPKYLQKLRVFNENQELLLWRSSEGLKGRLRTDTGGDDVCVADAEQALFGTRAETLNGYTIIREDRGTELALPFPELIKLNDGTKRNRVFLKTRNYIDYNEAHQATYVDCRFAGFIYDGNPLK